MACSKYNFKQSCYLQNMIATFVLKKNLQERQKTHTAWVFHASVFMHVYLVTLKNIYFKICIPNYNFMYYVHKIYFIVGYTDIQGDS